MADLGIKKRVAVIGAGASGLPAIKSVLEEDMIPVCFERSDGIGGLWYYKEEGKEDGQSTVMKSTVINTSKEKMCFSDYPIPAEFPNFMHNTKVLEYFTMYAKEFKLFEHIRFNSEVLKVDKTDDFEKTGRWNLRIKDKLTEQENEEIFDAVLVCTGHHGSVHWPKFPGSDEFQGRQLHSHDYKHYKGFENKRVVVIGIGNSGGDICVELGRCAKQVFIATRSGSWVHNRVAENGMPFDMIQSRGLQTIFRNCFPRSFLLNKAEARANARFDHAAYGLRPKHRINAQHATVNDDLPNRIICGAVVVKPNVKRLTKTGVEFEDGTYEDNIDAVIYATGYIFGFPFLDEDIIKVEKNVIRLFKYVFPPELKPSTLAIIGCFQPLGALMPLSEIQCRWATRVFKGLCELPSKGQMWKDIIQKEEAMRVRYNQSQRHTIQVDWLPFMDEMAEFIGCRPNLKELLLSDPKLAWHVYFRAITPYQYRLLGPHPWPGARQAIMTQWDRVFIPLRTRKIPTGAQKQTWFRYIIAAIILYIIIAWIF